LENRVLKVFGQQSTPSVYMQDFSGLPIDPSNRCWSYWHSMKFVILSLITLKYQLQLPTIFTLCSNHTVTITITSKM